jgi:hypothetical protein
VKEKPGTDTKAKPCVCNIVKRSGLVWKATGQRNAGQAEYQCKICGATAWRPA